MNLVHLDGQWRIRPDLDNQGLAGQWWSDWAAGGKDRPIDLPCAWQAVLGEDYHGVAWLWREVDLPRGWRSRKESGRQYWLRFESVATECRAWIDGVEVGRHVGDYLPFQFNVTDSIVGRRRIRIVLRVDEIHAARPGKEGDLQNGHITKGFHDVISLQHGGVWQPVCLARTGPLCAIPGGVSAVADVETGELRIKAGLEPIPRTQAGTIRVRVEVAKFNTPARWKAKATIAPDDDQAELTTKIVRPRKWSPSRPNLYSVQVDLLDGNRLSETRSVNVGFRSVAAGGRQGRTILLNGRPMLIRGILDWGHEPDHIAPAPTAEEVRSRFERLRRMGFNCVCLCMWYPPRYFFEIADEMGMLIWQEHPVWQSPMRDEDLAEYKRLFAGFMRRDVNHPSVIIVSATCEHPSFHPELAAWWWDTARDRLPDRLLQLQTAFFRWADLERTDLHDEHTYDNSNRWVTYLEDVQHHLESLPAKPFVMGETILFTSWPDLAGIGAENARGTKWWHPGAMDSKRAFERQVSERYGDATANRFRHQGDRFHLIGRKFQVEQFRRYPGNAGVVMNHLRDVPQCQCGFMDDLGQWRFDPAMTRGWLGDVAVLLLTPDQRRGFIRPETGRVLECQIAVSNFGIRDLDEAVRIRMSAGGSPPIELEPISVKCDVGQVVSGDCRLPLPVAKGPTWCQVTAFRKGRVANWWDLWVFPQDTDKPPPAAVHMAGLPFTESDAEPDEEERAYSRGYGLAVRNWECVLPDPAVLLPNLQAWGIQQPLPAGSRVVLTHRITNGLVDFLEAGGRVVLLASKAEGGLGTRYEWLFGGVPLIIEEGPLAEGDSNWIVDLLGYDLTRRYCRVIPVEELGIADQVDPLIRLVYTHDQNDRVRFFDLLFMARIGEGLLIVSSLDHSEDAGQYLLRRIIDYARADEAAAQTELASTFLRKWAVESATPTH